MGRSRAAPRSRKKTSGSDEAKIIAAVAFLQELPVGERINFTATAAKFDVKCGTLRNRYCGFTKSPKAAHEHQKLLTSAREEILLEWMFHHAEEGRPWGRETIRIKVFKVTGKKPSHEWVKAFRKRHEDELKFCGASGLDPKRAQAFNPNCIADHFQKLGEARAQYKYKIHNIYNFDETGMQLGGGRKRTGKKWFLNRRARAKYKQRDANLELVTVVECACADGSLLDPGFIFQGAHTYDIEWFRNYPNISVGLTENGWTDDGQCLKWFENVFLPQARRRAEQYGDRDDLILLIFDGHGSHLTDEMRESALAHGVHFHKLRAHTTHKTQPCDVGCFGPMSKKWLERMEEIVEETHQGLPKHEFVNEYMAVRNASITPESVVAAFKQTGIEPFNPNIYTDEDFAPSRVTSIHAHMPSSYPDAQPTLLLSESNNGTVVDTGPGVVADKTGSSAHDHDENMAVVHDEAGSFRNGARDDNPPGSVIDPALLDDTESNADAMPVDNDGMVPAHLHDEPHFVWYHDSDDTFPIGFQPHNDHSIPTTPTPPSTSTSTHPTLVPASTSFPADRWGPKVPQFKTTILASSASEHVRLRTAQEDLQRLEKLYLEEFERRQKLEMHADLARLEIATLKKQLHAKHEKAEGRKGFQFQSAADFMMSSESMAAWQVSKEERAEKERAEAEKAAAKAATEKENEERRGRLVHDSDVRYRGSLKSKRKSELEDIATLLAISFTGKTTNPQLVILITTRLNQQRRTLSLDARFEGLYPNLPEPSPSSDEPQSDPLPPPPPSPPHPPSTAQTADMNTLPAASEHEAPLTPNQPPSAPAVESPSSQSSWALNQSHRFHPYQYPAHTSFATPPIHYPLSSRPRPRPISIPGSSATPDRDNSENIPPTSSPSHTTPFGPSLLYPGLSNLTNSRLHLYSLSSTPPTYNLPR